MRTRNIEIFVPSFDGYQTCVVSVLRRDSRAGGVRRTGRAGPWRNRIDSSRTVERRRKADEHLRVVRPAGDSGYRANCRKRDVSRGRAREREQANPVARVVQERGDDRLVNDERGGELVAGLGDDFHGRHSGVQSGSMEMIRPRGARSSVRKSSRPPADSMNA